MLPRMDLRPEYLTPLMEFLKILDIPMPEVRDIHQEYCCPFVQKGSAAIMVRGYMSVYCTYAFLPLLHSGQRKIYFCHFLLC